jgi:flavin reductase (DIM6/NTAB) family NADH-FMN oxidoreductase RutF
MEIDLKALEARHAHDLLTSSIIPRPIAWVSSINQDGKTNLAPFSFFTGVSWSPPIVAFSVVNRADGTMKDTVVNIENVPEFVINIVSTDLLTPMECSAKPIPYGEDESYVKGIHLAPSRIVKPYRVQEAKISLECTLERIVRVSEGANAGNLVLGQVQLLHVKDELVKNGREVDWYGLDVLGRLSGNRYCAVRSAIESETN